jgi:hypothetical protein
MGFCRWLVLFEFLVFVIIQIWLQNWLLSSASFTIFRFNIRLYWCGFRLINLNRCEEGSWLLLDSNLALGISRIEVIIIFLGNWNHNLGIKAISGVFFISLGHWWDWWFYSVEFILLNYLSGTPGLLAYAGFACH